MLTAHVLEVSAGDPRLFTTTTVGLASGRSVDALAAGPVVGRTCYPLQLKSPPTGARAWLAAQAKGDVVVIGGPTAVSGPRRRGWQEDDEVGRRGVAGGAREP